MNKISVLIGNINETKEQPARVHILVCTHSIYLALTHSSIEARAALAHVNHVVTQQATRSCCSHLDWIN